MRHALALACRGWGQVHPNPLVGAVVVRDGRVVGEGWHAAFGGLHAETMALAAAGDQARGGTLFVTLEPCAHHGKQPPCTDAIIAAGITRVVVGMRDPNPEAAGGMERLASAGIPVAVGVLATDVARQNVRFLARFDDRPRPFVAVKLAVTMDGCLADAHGASQWISGEEARDWVHWLRAGFGGVAVGAETALRDRVRLTVRGRVTPRIPPWRVVFDRSGRVPGDHPLFLERDAGPALMVVGALAAEHRRDEIERAGGRLVVADTLADGLRELRGLGLESLLVEGGGRLASALLQERLVDRIYQIQCPVWVGAGLPAWPGLGTPQLAAATRWRTVASTLIGGDTILELER